MAILDNILALLTQATRSTSASMKKTRVVLPTTSSVMLRSHKRNSTLPLIDCCQNSKQKRISPPNWSVGVSWMCCSSRWRWRKCRQKKHRTRNRLEKWTLLIVEGWCGKAKGLNQICWEMGLLNPLETYTKAQLVALLQDWRGGDCCSTPGGSFVSMDLIQNPKKCNTHIGEWILLKKGRMGWMKHESMVVEESSLCCLWWWWCWDFHRSHLCQKVYVFWLVYLDYLHEG